MTLQPGTIIEGKYRILRMIGKGGMGSVYEGENERIRRRVAIKILHSEVSDKAEFVQRFEREAQAAGRIGSAHIVEVLDLGSLASGERFMVMEYLDGESLAGRIKTRERIPPHEFAPILYSLLEGIALAHEAHIIHRDLKPDNVYLVNSKNQPDFVKILDFGVSKFTAATVENDLHKTSTGMIMGTPYYMSPEQIRCETVDARTDVYSIGVILYYAVTGKLPFRAQRFTDLALKITMHPYESPESIVPLDPQFAAIIVKAMHRERNMRFQSAREFQAAIGQWMATNAVAPNYPRQSSQQPNSLPPNMVAAAHMNQAHGAPTSAPWPATDNRPTPSSSSVSGGVVIPTQQAQAQLGATHVTPMGTSHMGLGISQPVVPSNARPTTSSSMMIALGLFGTLFVAVCGMLVYTFVIDQPAAVAPTEATSAVAAAQPPPPTTATQEAAPAVAPTNSADAAPPPTAGSADDTAASTKSTSKKSRTTPPSTGGGGGKTPPPPTTGGRKMTGEL